MLHELKRIIADALIHQSRGTKCVLATVVDLEGSSYRQPGVRMLIADSGKMTGAISGGCVEKEICRRAASVFDDGQAKVVTYDGRFRLGCEGLLFVLIEPFYVSDELLEAFSKGIRERVNLTMTSSFERADDARGRFGSKLEFVDGDVFFFNESPIAELEHTFVQYFEPCFRLLIIGSEHDAVQLCLFASLLGWEVEILSSSEDPKARSDFPGAQKISDAPIEDFSIDSQTAVVLMTHNYASDLKFLLSLKDRNPIYVGVLGTEKRRDQLRNDMVEFRANIGEFSKSIFSPTGLDIGAISPGEIAVSILAEITSVVRKKSAVSLRSLKT